jgi:NADH-quinone oxidoreductase subunit M
MDELNRIILSCLIFVPIVGALLVSLLPRGAARPAAVLVAVANFVLSLHLVAHWNDAASTRGFCFEETREWLPQLGLNYHLGLDGASLFLVLLSTFLTPLVLVAARKGLNNRGKELAVCLLVLEAATIGAFSALDTILFYIFFEATLIPVYIMISGWGGAERSYAALKFFLYTMAGSVLMWVALLYIYFAQTRGERSFDYANMVAAANNLEAGGNSIAIMLFLGIAAAFAIKAPIFPLHTWQPDAYAESPTPATVILAAVLSKLGIYGFLRFAIPFFPQTATQLAPIFITLAIIGIIYGALVATAQTDLKRLLAYSSLSHVSLIVLGVFAALVAGTQGRDIANSGVIIQMLNHGLTTAALFLLAGMLIERRNSRVLGDFGGLAAPMPRFTVLFWIAMFASIGLPGLNGFVGEYLILQGTMFADFRFALLGALGVILGAVYMLRAFRRLMYGEITHEENRNLRDTGRRETLVMAVVLAVIVWIGVMPQPFLSLINGGNAQVETAPVAQTASQELLAQRR